jgi:hypothetical protein
MHAEPLAEIRAAIAATQADGAHAAALVNELTDQRRAALLAGDDRRLAEVERELLQAERERERAKLRLDDLHHRLAAAEQAERDAERDRERQELTAACRAKLEVAARIDVTLATLAELVAQWECLDGPIRARWTVAFADRFGPYQSEMIDARAPLRGAVPPKLALALRMHGNAFGSHPLAETDPCHRVLARLEAGPVTEPPRSPEPAGVTIRHVGSEAGVRRLGA